MPYGIKPKKKVHTRKFDRCVMKVKKQKRTVNPYAVCTSSLGESSFRKSRK